MFGPIARFYRKHKIICHLLLMALTTVALVLGSMGFVDLWTAHGSVTTVPEIRGMRFEEARNALEEADLVIAIHDSIFNPDLEPGKIIDVWPKGNTTVKPHRTVFVTINSFNPKMVTIRNNIFKVSSRQVRAYFLRLGVPEENITEVEEPYDYNDLVLGVTANGRTLRMGSSFPLTAKIVIKVGKEPERMSITDEEEEEVQAVVKRTPAPTVRRTKPAPTAPEHSQSTESETSSETTSDDAATHAPAPAPAPSAEDDVFN